MLFHLEHTPRLLMLFDFLGLFLVSVSASKDTGRHSVYVFTQGEGDIILETFRSLGSGKLFLLLNTFLLSIFSVFYLELLVLVSWIDFLVMFFSHIPSLTFCSTLREVLLEFSL